MNSHAMGGHAMGGHAMGSHAMGSYAIGNNAMGQTLKGSAATAAPNPWITLTVRDFFTRVNWTDQPPEVQSIQISTLQGDQPTLSLQLTVSQFFSSIPWDGRAVAAPLESQTVIDTSSNQSSAFTVDDFAGLF
ncbi:hypothetical protein PROH_16545 [Prochlorothrix hollandica PCC 9006 = CALU 1027]|uniref:Uncharacterized protein n=2 Tax=Prochlorothrix hollandica TaxID=1223 RepID=A0A0M2PXD1_PROHO|nr:hypothetical protein PROH_16545 [Prochlorothrix hollandica PCC 9006 = CALU 1027]